MAKQTRVNITKIPEGQLFKWNRAIYRKVGKTQAINTRTGKKTSFYDGCTVILVSDEETGYD